MESCPFKDYFDSCSGFINKDDTEQEIKQQRAVDTINEASKIRNSNITVEIGSIVHKDCRRKYINKVYLESVSKKRKIDETPVRTLRSQATSGFNYQTHCILCESIVVDYNDKRLDDVYYRAASINCQISFEKCCDQRDDDWGKKVKNRILHISNSDFRAMDVYYHKQCSTNFRIGKSIPQKFISSNVSELRSVGRPKDNEKLKAFQLVMDNFYDTNDETITVSELIKRMGTIVSDPYSHRTMKRELANIEGIRVTQIGKEKNIVSTITSASRVLDEFHKKKNSVMSETQWKKEIIQTASALIKAEIDDIKEDRIYYPDISDISDIEMQLNYVPFLLRHFLGNIFKSRMTDMKITIAALGQAIMQQQRPRSLMAPMQFALTMRVYDECPGLLSNLFKNGFCLSENEAKLFKASAAYKNPDPFQLSNGKFGWIIGDNFDHNKITLTGHDTIHVMGLMMTKTPSEALPNKVFRCDRNILNEKPSDLIQIREIKQLKDKELDKKIIYKIVSDITAEDSRQHLDMLWKISLAYRMEKIGWQGYMMAITDGEHTGKASVHFLPMVNLDPNSWKCVYSVLMYGRDNCKKMVLYQCFPLPSQYGGLQDR